MYFILSIEILKLNLNQTWFEHPFITRVELEPREYKKYI